MNSNISPIHRTTMGMRDTTTGTTYTYDVVKPANRGKTAKRKKAVSRWPFIGNRVVIRDNHFHHLKRRFGYVVGDGDRYVFVAVAGLGIYPIARECLWDAPLNKPMVVEKTELANLILEFTSPDFLQRRHNERSNSSTAIADPGESGGSSTNPLA